MPPRPPRLAILGAGPVGVEAALCASHFGFRVTMYERGSVGEHVDQWGHVRLFSPFGMNTTALGLATITKWLPEHELPESDACITGREYAEVYLRPLIDCLESVDVYEGTEVVSIGRRGASKLDTEEGTRSSNPFLVLVLSEDGERVEEADFVLDCTGTYSQPRWLGEGGMPAIGERDARAVIDYRVEDILGSRMDRFADKSVLVYGGGYSAATSVSLLAKLAESHPGTWVIWANRSTRSQPIHRFMDDPLRERDRLASAANRLATRSNEANVEYHQGTIVSEVHYEDEENGFLVRGLSAGKEITWEVDRVIANVGYDANMSILQELHVLSSPRTGGPHSVAESLKNQPKDCLSICASNSSSLVQHEPGFFVLGAKSFGRNSHFLMRTGFQQVRQVMSLLTGKPPLALDRTA